MPITPAMIARNAQLADQTARPARMVLRERSHSDELITPETAVTSSAVIAIITLMSQDLASLPLLLYARKGRNKFRAYDSPYYKLMHDQPNPEMSSMVFRELIMSHMLAWGNFFAQKIWDKNGVVIELWPLRPDRMTVERKDGQKIYRYTTAEGKPRVFFSDEILHIPAFGFDGLIGYSRIALARNAIGLAISAEKFGSKFYSNGVNVGIIYKHPAALSDAAYDRLKADLDQKVGVAESNKPIILEEGMSLERIGIPPDDRQFLETRKFQLAEINRMIGPVPPHMIGDVTTSTSWGTGIDSQEQGYVNHTLRPYAVRTEQALDMQLMLPEDRTAGYYYEHLFDALLRGDIATRFEAYTKAINNGILSPNEVRGKENMNPYTSGDVYWRPLNMASSTDTGSVDQAASASALTLTPGHVFGTVQLTSSPDASALEPLWREAVLRVLKRESNDIQGASKRYQVKGQQDAFVSFVENFYRHDHAAFMAKQLKPIVDATNNIYGVDVSKAVDVLSFQFLNGRRENILKMSALEIEQDFENYDMNADFILDAISGMMEPDNE